jgi:hypothetical protein
MRLSLRSVLAALSLIAVLVAVSGTALAQEDQREASARELFAMGKYADARAIYVKLYAETTHPTYLRNIGRCAQNLGEPDAAIASFREYLRQGRDITPEQRAQVEGYIKEMEELKSKHESAAATAPVPALSGSPPLPAAAPPAEPPGSPPAVPMISTAQPAHDVEGSGTPWSTQKVIGVSVAGAGVVGVAIGSVFGLQARSNNNEALGMCPTGTCATLEILARHDRLVTDATQERTRAIVAFAAGGAVLIGGVVLALTAPTSAAEAPTHVAFWGTGRDAGIMAVGRW